jgi:hypothetical protein
MQRLSHRDFHAALRFLASCDASAGLHGFAVSVANALSPLIPSGATVFARPTSVIQLGAITPNRDRRDFSERDPSLLPLLEPESPGDVAALTVIASSRVWH